MRLATLGGVALGLAASITTGTARAALTSTGFEIGLRSGYSLPFGNTIGATNGQSAPNLSDGVKGVVPIWFDASYRFNKNMFVGANFQYGIGVLNTDNVMGCNQGGVSCTVSDLLFGVEFHYHLLPDGHFDPWAGIGIGYEIYGIDISGGGADIGGNDNGFQFFNVQLGVDYKETPNFGIGPFLMFSLGQFSSCSTSVSGIPGATAQSCSIPNAALHEWFTIGLRMAYDIHVHAAAAPTTPSAATPSE